MKVGNRHYRTIWLKEDDVQVVQAIDQRWLPHTLTIEDICTLDQMVVAITDMHVRGAGLIGAAAGYGMYLAAMEALNSNSFENYMIQSAQKLLSARPTAINLSWAVNRQLHAIHDGRTDQTKVDIARDTSEAIADEDARHCKAIGEIGVHLIRKISKVKNGETVNVLTHCNAGWLAFVDYGTATAPVYKAFDEGIDIHVWVDETRPRNQGSRLTAWELNEYGIPHTVITDNAGGHLMQRGQVDLVITGTDRTTADGDVTNKIGTYLKALAAHDNDIPFYVALPTSSFDWKIVNAMQEIPIEQRDADEVRYMHGLSDGEMKRVLLTPEMSPAANYAFDITPARLVTGLITDRGICRADRGSILQLYPEYKEY